MTYLRRSLVLFVVLISACGAPLRQAPPEISFPTAAIAHTAYEPLPPTPNHALIDTPILDDLAATPSAATAQPAQEITPQPTPQLQPAPQPQPRREPTRLVIGDIGLDRALIPVGLDADTNPIVPKHDAAWFDESAAPGQGDNIVLWGHALRFRDSPDIPAPFGQLSQLKLGTSMVLYTSAGAAYNYTITHQLWVTPDQVGYIMPTGTERVTIVSCIGDQVIDGSGAVVNMTHRLITIAEPRQGNSG